MHITLHKIDHQEKAYWIAHMRQFRANMVAVLVGLEDHEASDKARDLKGLKSIGFALGSALKYGYNGLPKSRKLYIWRSNTSFGKRRWLNFLDRHMSTSRLPEDQYYVDYTHKMYQVLVSDATETFVRNKAYSHLKDISEDLPIEFSRKGKTKVAKEDHPLLLLADHVRRDTLMKRAHAKSYSQEVMTSHVKDFGLRSRSTLGCLIDRCPVVTKKSAASQSQAADKHLIKT